MSRNAVAITVFGVAALVGGVVLALKGQDAAPLWGMATAALTAVAGITVPRASTPAAVKFKFPEES